MTVYLLRRVFQSLLVLVAIGETVGRVRRGRRSGG